VTDPLLFVAESQYDANRRKILTIHHNGNISAAPLAEERTTYDVLGRAYLQEGCATISGSSCSTWQTLKHTYFTPTSKVDHEQDGAGDTTSYLYDPMDRVQMITDPVGRRTATVYDVAGQTLFMWRAWNSSTPPVASQPWDPTSYNSTLPLRYAAYQYSANGRQIIAQDANNNTTQAAYDGFDRIRLGLFPDPGTGHVCTIVDVPNSNYDDPAGNPSCTSANQAPQATFEKCQYDANGNRLVWQRRDASVINFTYDKLSRQRTKQPPGASSGYVYTNYDLAGRPLYARYGSDTGSGVVYGFDSAKRVISEATGSLSIGFAYDVSNNRTKVTWPDGNYVNYDYDGLNRNYKIRENNASSGAGVLATYVFDPLARRTQLTRGNGTVTTWGYDAASRLQTLAQDMVGTTQDLTVTLGYTLASQLQTRSSNNTLYKWSASGASSLSYSPDALNRYASVSGTSYQYDARGNLTNDGTRSMTYDVENRLTGVGSNQLSYDPLGRLSQTVMAGTATQFLYSGDRLIAEYNGTGTTVLRRYVHGTGTDEPIVWYEGSGVTTRNWLHADERGSVIATTDGTGTATIYQYGPYGAPSVWTGSRFKYTSQISVPEASLYHYKARMYDPALGRFLQTDPIGSKDDLNLYAYVYNDPIDRTDPTGLDCKSKGGTTTCDIQVTGSHIPKTISFKTPKGVAEGTLRSSSLAEHHYSYPSPHNKSDSAVQQSMVADPTPNPSNKPATANGTPNDATPPGTRGLLAQASAELLGDNPKSPVISYSARATDGNTWVLNVTELGHGLHFGYVLRGSVDGTAYSIGEGWAIKQNVPILGGYVDDVWKQQNQTNIDEAQ